MTTTSSPCTVASNNTDDNTTLKIAAIERERERARDKARAFALGWSGSFCIDDKSILILTVLTAQKHLLPLHSVAETG